MSVIYPAAFQRAQVEAVAPRRTAEQIRLQNEAQNIAAAAIGTANAHERMGNPVAAKERLISAARDLNRLYESRKDSRLPEILALIETMYQRAREIRTPRLRSWRRRPGSIVGFLR